jgi:hypothetical protein
MAQRRLSLKILLVKFCSNTSAVRTLAYNHNSGLCDRYRLLAGHLSAILLNINVNLKRQFVALIRDVNPYP